MKFEELQRDQAHIWLQIQFIEENRRSRRGEGGGDGEERGRGGSDCAEEEKEEAG